MTGKGALLITNRRADFDPDEMERATKWFQDQGITIYRSVTTSDPKEVAAAVAGCKGVDMLILGGGDGTISHAAETVLKSGLPLGILPMGTANDLARTLGIPRSIEGAFQVIAQGHIHRIDLGMMNGKLFFNVAHIGLGAEVTRSLSTDSKARWGALSYAKRALDVFKKNRSFRAHVICEGEHRNIRTIEIAVGNGRYYGGGITVWEGAAIDDGELNLFYIKPSGFLQITASLPSVIHGKARKRDWIRYMHGRNISIRTSRTLFVSADGELRTQTPVQFEILPAALPVFVPPATD